MPGTSPDAPPSDATAADLTLKYAADGFTQQELEDIYQAQVRENPNQPFVFMPEQLAAVVAAMQKAAGGDNDRYLALAEDFLKYIKARCAEDGKTFAPIPGG